MNGECSIFRGDDGEPVLSDCAVLFLDLLGTAGPRGDADVLEHLRRTKAAVHRARDDIKDSDVERDRLHRATWFSDNLNLYYAATEEVSAGEALDALIRDVAFLQLGFLIEDLVARGAIAFDRFYADEEFLYGPALDRAVLLEKTRARFPRVVLDEASIAVARRASQTRRNDDGVACQPLLCVDNMDGAVFVDYLSALRVSPDNVDLWGSILLAHRHLIETGLRRYDGIAGVEEKYRWLAGYHAYFVAGHGRMLKHDENPSELIVDCSRPIGDFAIF
jgi:hypothetical protein